MDDIYGYTNGGYSICGDCGAGFGTPKEGGIGMWEGVCDICGEKAYLANAKHDFGLTDDDVAIIRGEDNA
jgi:hypothetical protein